MQEKKQRVLQLLFFFNEGTRENFRICIMAWNCVCEGQTQSPFPAESWLYSAVLCASGLSLLQAPLHGAAVSLRTLLTAAQEARDSNVTSN